MLSKILVPLDGSALADSILTQVRRLLVREDAEIMLLRVLRPLAAIADDQAREQEVQSASRYLEEHWRRLTEQGARVRYELMDGDPAEQILVFAETYKPSLIAMSSHGRTGLDRVRRGSVAERVLRRSTQPLLLSTPLSAGLPAELKDLRFRRILVPLDGSDQSARILTLIEHFAQLYESEIILLNAVLPYPDYAALSGVPGLDATADSRASLEPYRERLEKSGVRSRSVVLVKHPSAAILDTAQEEKVDLVAMTTHGRAGLSRWVFGSIAEKVLHHCPCPMLVMRTTGFSEGIEGFHGRSKV